VEISHKQKIVFVFLLIFALPGFTYFLRDGFHGLDSYYFLTKVCREDNHFTASPNSPLGNIVFDILPCDEFILKAILVFLYGLSVLAIYLIGEETWKGSGWITLLFTGITPIFLYSSFKLENDAFGFPIMFFGVYFFLKYLNSKKDKGVIKSRPNYSYLIISVLLILLATGFWGGALYYILFFVLMEPLMLIIAIPVFILFAGQLIETIIPKLDIDESTPRGGLTFILLYMVPLVFFKGKPDFRFWYLPLTIVLFVVGALNPKFFILGIPFFALALTKNFLNATKGEKRFIAGWATILFLFYSLSVVALSSPTNMETEIASDLVYLAQEKDLRIANDWELGHLIWYYGGHTAQHSGGKDPDFANEKNRLIATQQVLENCEKIEEYQQRKILFQLRPNYFIYEC